VEWKIPGAFDAIALPSADRNDLDSIRRRGVVSTPDRGRPIRICVAKGGPSPQRMKPEQFGEKSLPEQLQGLKRL
jgi:hypothetical protein